MNSPRSLHTCVARSAALLTALAAVDFASAAAITWVGNTDTNLLTAANWSPSGVPVSGTDSFVFGAAGTQGTSLTLGSGYSASFAGGASPAIDFTNAAPAYTFSGAGQLTVATGGLRNQSGQTQTFNNPFRFNTGSGHTLTNANSSLVFGNTTTLSATTTTINMGSATGHSVTFNGNLANASANTLAFGGGVNASTVNINGSANTGIGTLTIGQNVRVNLGSSTALGNATTVNLNGTGSTIANASGSALTTNASLAFSAATQNYTFGATGHTDANNLTFNGTAAITADQTRTITLNGTGLTVASASVWNNSVAGNRSLTVNGAGNTLGLGGLAIGASGEINPVTLTLSGSGNIALSGGITIGSGTGTRSLQNNGGTLKINGSSNYNGTTGIGGNSTLLVNGTHTGGGNYSVGGILGGTGTIDLAAGSSVSFVFNSGNYGGKLQASSADPLVFSGGASTVLNLTNAVAPTAAPSLFFTLGAPGSTAVDVQGGLNIGTSLFDWNDFSFTAGTGFGAGNYNLFQYDTLIGTLGTSLTGVIGGFTATMSNDVANKSIMLSVVPEPTSALAGLLLAAGLLRRRRLLS